MHLVLKTSLQLLDSTSGFSLVIPTSTGRFFDHPIYTIIYIQILSFLFNNSTHWFQLLGVYSSSFKKDLAIGNWKQGLASATNNDWGPSSFIILK